MEALVKSDARRRNLEPSVCMGGRRWARACSNVKLRADWHVMRLGAVRDPMDGIFRLLTVPFQHDRFLLRSSSLRRQIAMNLRVGQFSSAAPAQQD